MSRPPPVPQLHRSAQPVDAPRHDSGVERRASPRVPLEVEVNFTSESHFFVGLTGDLSEGGLFIATWRSVAVGSVLDLTLSLPDGPIEGRGRVQWVRGQTEGGPPGLGVAFEMLSAEGRARIERFCAARAPWYYDV